MSLLANRSVPPLTLRFTLPAELEAREPAEARGIERDGVRLLISERSERTIAAHRHALFGELPSVLRPGDLLVVNASATLPAALPATLPSGEPIALHYSSRTPDGVWIVEPRSPLVAAGMRLDLPGAASATLLRRHGGSPRLWVARFDTPSDDFIAYLHANGAPIGYAYLRRRWPLKTYQTIFATVPGSAEMPSAGRPFTARTLRDLAARGVRVAPIVLHTGVASPERDEPPYAEPFAVPETTAAAIRHVKASGGRVIAVGTTVVRALESAVETTGRATARAGWTDLVITPARGVRLVDGLLTGLHEPKSTHLAMLAAIAGGALLASAYAEALEHRYLWHEFGDAHLIL